VIAHYLINEIITIVLDFRKYTMHLKPYFLGNIGEIYMKEILSPFDDRVYEILEDVFEELPVFSDDDIPFNIKYYKVGGRTGSFKQNKIFYKYYGYGVFPPLVYVSNGKVHVGYEINSNLKRVGFPDLPIYNINMGRMTINSDYQVLLSIMELPDDPYYIMQFTLIDVDDIKNYYVFHFKSQFTKYKYSNRVIDVFDTSQKLYDFFYDAIVNRESSYYEYGLSYVNNDYIPLTIYIDLKDVSPYALNNLFANDGEILSRIKYLFDKFIETVNNNCGDVLNELCNKFKLEYTYGRKKDCDFNLVVNRHIMFELKYMSEFIEFKSYGEILPVIYERYINKEVAECVLTALVKTFLY